MIEPEDERGVGKLIVLTERELEAQRRMGKIAPGTTFRRDLLYAALVVAALFVFIDRSFKKPIVFTDANITRCGKPAAVSEFDLECGKTTRL